MSSRRSFATFTAATLCAFAVANSPTPNAAAVAARFGTAHGTWELPFGAQNGYIDGDFFAAAPSTTPNQTPVYHITGSLVAAPVLCPNCVAGSIHALLSDGIASTPDYFVTGNYSGTWSNGSGTFTAQIFRPTSAAPVGWFKGTFSDPPLLPVLGHFDGRWVIQG